MFICTPAPLYTISAPVCAVLLIRLSIGPKMHQWKGCGDQKQMLQWWENRHMLIDPDIRGFVNCILWQNALRYSSHPLLPTMQYLRFNNSHPVRLKIIHAAKFALIFWEGTQETSTPDWVNAEGSFTAISLGNMGINTHTFTLQSSRSSYAHLYTYTHECLNTHWTKKNKHIQELTHEKHERKSHKISWHRKTKATLCEKKEKKKQDNKRQKRHKLRQWHN